MAALSSVLSADALSVEAAGDNASEIDGAGAPPPSVRLEPTSTALVVAVGVGEAVGLIAGGGVDAAGVAAAVTGITVSAPGLLSPESPLDEAPTGVVAWPSYPCPCPITGVHLTISSCV